MNRLVAAEVCLMAMYLMDAAAIPFSHINIWLLTAVFLVASAELGGGQLLYRRFARSLPFSRSD